MEFDPMQGLLNIKPQRMVDPTTQGLLAAAMAGLNASGPSRMPVGLGQVFGQAMGAGTGALQQANMQNDMAQKNNLAMQMQMYLLKKGMEGEQRTKQARTVLSNPNATPEERNAAMLALDPKLAIERMFPKQEAFSLTPGQTRFGPDGQPMASLPAEPPKLTFQDTGAGIQAFNPITGQPVGAVIPKSATPDTNARLAWDQYQFQNPSAYQQAQLANEGQGLGIRRAELFYNTGMAPMGGGAGFRAPAGAPSSVAPSAPSGAPNPSNLPPALAPGAMSPKRQSELNATRPQETQALNGVRMNLDTAIETANSLLTSGGLNKITGPIAGRTPNLTGDATNAQAYLDTLKAQIGAQVLQAMRDASKTGGAVGNVTEKEWPILQNQLGALQQAQTTGQFRMNLMNVRSTLKKMKANAEKAYKDVFGDLPDVPSPAPDAPVSRPSGNAIDDLLNKYAPGK